MTTSLARATFLATALALPAGVAADPVVVELFTSQGCSSCPPADEMLGQLAHRDDVIALSLHVDYWDWIGWADTFADPAYSDRQRGYAAAAGSSVVYTPQFVVGGVDQVAGPSGMELADLIVAHDGVTGDILRQGEGRKVVAASSGKRGQLIRVIYRPETTVRILRGENAGRNITYHNVVESWTVLSDWDGRELQIDVPAAPDGMAQAVLAQAVNDGKPGAILGAVRVD
ncbi:DUF1223 domain-containing protein [Jannaschia sp. S6380]|uniref:DUF1223 domain-containing protein n=1 Tax=Jannaschia sp. S6380 TaxID=2926408 RepID=UPI001FF111CB|nr:DUF1223 domain-containing protein [Jannaschia sp. S6380]MCK0166137.1 DUF1223 domain-containing protein [Jannaschia sp. S6380]